MASVGPPAYAGDVGTGLEQALARLAAKPAAVADGRVRILCIGLADACRMLPRGLRP
jgi:hypothetical protein